MTDYEVLKRFGFSPFIASQIVLDCGRGDKYALMTLAVAKGCA